MTFSDRVKDRCRQLGITIKELERTAGIANGYIRSTSMQGFVNEMSAVSSPKTVRNYYGLLGAVLKQNGLAVPFADCLRR